MTDEFKMIRKWANGEILTSTAPSDRYQLKKFVEAYDKAQLELNYAAQRVASAEVRAEALEAKLSVAIEALEKIRGTK